MPYKTAFMSHAHADNATCDPYADALKKRGISLYYDRTNPQVGRDLSSALEQEIQRADALIVMATRASLASFWVGEEIDMFMALMAQNPQNPSRLLIPVKLEPCELPPRLAARWWIDATTMSRTQAVDEIVKALKARQQDPRSDPLRTTDSSRDTASRQPPVLQDPPPVGITRRAFVVLGTAGIAALGGWLLWRSHTSTTTTGLPLAPFTYRGHSGAVNSVAWAPHGRHIASASADQTVQIWDAATHVHLFTYGGHSYIVLSAAWSPNGVRIASASSDNTVQVWDAADGGNRTTLNGHADAVNWVSWSPDGTRIASASDDRTVRVWDADTSVQQYVYHGHQGGVASVAWSPNGMHIASASDDQTVRVWSAADGADIFTYRGHSDAVSFAAWSPDGTRIASASFDNTVQVWDAANGSHPFIYRGHSDSALTMSWSPDGKRIASAGADKTVQVWDAADGSHPFIYRGHTSQVNAVAWSPNGLNIASASNDKTVQVWQPQ